MVAATVISATAMRIAAVSTRVKFAAMAGAPTVIPVAMAKILMIAPVTLAKSISAGMAIPAPLSICAYRMAVAAAAHLSAIQALVVTPLASALSPLSSARQAQELAVPKNALPMETVWTASKTATAASAMAAPPIIVMDPATVATPASGLANLIVLEIA